MTAGQQIVLAVIVAPIFVAAVVFFGSYLFDKDED